MRKSFMKPFAITIGTLLVATAANASVTVKPVVNTTEISASQIAGAELVLDHAVNHSLQLDAHRSHSSHASHASHASHSSHASSAY